MPYPGTFRDRALISGALSRSVETLTAFVHGLPMKAKIQFSQTPGMTFKRLFSMSR